jgi:hypothetical protein
MCELAANHSVCYLSLRVGETFNLEILPLALLIKSSLEGREE